MAQGDNNAGRRDFATLVSIGRELDLLVRGLAGDRREDDRLAKELVAKKKDEPLDAGARWVASRRKLSASALERVISFLISAAVRAAHPDVARLNLPGPLLDIKRALQELDAGAPAELFALAPGRPKRVASPTDARFRGQVAAIAELLVMHDDPPDGTARRRAETKACERVAAVLGKIGYRTPRGSKASGSSKSERALPAVITAATVRGWLVKARDPTPQDEKIGEAFKERIELARHRKARGGSYGATAAKMMALLAQDMPGALLRVTPLKGDPPPQGNTNSP